MPASPRKRRRRSGGDTSSKVHAAPVPSMPKAIKRIATVSDLYGGGETGRFLNRDVSESPKVRQLIQRRHDKVSEGIDRDGVYRRGSHEWKVPLGVRLSLQRPLVWGQIVNQYPWFVTWVSPKTGKRMKKFFNTALGGIAFIATKAQYVDKHSALVSRQVGYDIPPPLRGKIPLPWRWCPYCMTARKYRRVSPAQEFYALVKKWDEEKQRWVPLERRLAVMECNYCHTTNKEPRMRRSNQVWVTRRLKPSARRVRRKQ